MSIELSASVDEWNATLWREDGEQVSVPRPLIEQVIGSRVVGVVIYGALLSLGDNGARLDVSTLSNTGDEFTEFALFGWVRLDMLRSLL